MKIILVYGVGRQRMACVEFISDATIDQDPAWSLFLAWWDGANHIVQGNIVFNPSGDDLDRFIAFAKSCGWPLGNTLTTMRGDDHGISHN